jgi:HemY protein
LLRTIWFFIKIAAISAGAIWLVTLEGDVHIDFLNYKIDMQTGFFAFVVTAIVLSFIFVFKLINAVFSAPKNIVKLYEADRRKKSFRALTRGLVAVAAGDEKRATQYSKQTKYLWPDLKGLPLLLEAQAAKLRGEEGLAQNRFERLLKDKDATFLGVRGLLKSALDEGNIERALDFARQAEKQHPKKDWIVRIVYELEIKNRQWTDALRTNHKLQKLKKNNSDDLQKLKSDRVAIYLHHHDKALRKGDKVRAKSEVETAYKLDPTFIPSVTRYCDLLLQDGKNRKCAKVIEQAWRENTHPDMAKIWARLAPVPKGKSPDKDHENIKAWFDKLISFNPESAEAQMAAASAAMDAGHWGEAKAHLIVAEKLYPSARVYRMQAIVEQNSTHNDEFIHRLMERAANALPDKRWVCQETGMIYDEWKAIAKPHGSFNTIQWDVPGARVLKTGQDVLSASNDIGLLIDPAA